MEIITNVANQIDSGDFAMGKIREEEDVSDSFASVNNGRQLQVSKNFNELSHNNISKDDETFSFN